jgi:hypothetical protein
MQGTIQCGVGTVRQTLWPGVGPRASIIMCPARADLSQENKKICVRRFG